MVFDTPEEIVACLSETTLSDQQKSTVFTIMVDRMETAIGGSKADLVEHYAFHNW
jgi:hypothetical protein